MSEHGRVTYFSLDDLAGTPGNLSSYLRSAPGLPGKSERPQTTTFGATSHLRALVGIREGGPIELGGFLRRTATASIHGRQTRILADEYSFGGNFTGATVTRSVDLPDTTTFGEDWRRHQVVGIKDVSLSMTGQFDPAAGKSDPRFRAWLASASAVLFACAPEGFAIGNLVDMFQAVQGEYTVGSELESVVPVSGSFEGHDDCDLGVSLHDLTAETTTVNSTSVDLTDVTTTSGWVAQLHVTALTGSGCTIKVQDSADNGAFADLSGATFANVTAVTKERLSSATGTVRRYVRSAITAMAASSITYVVAFFRRGATTATAGTYKHLAGLFGATGTSSFEHGPEGNTTGDRKHSGECRLQQLVTTYSITEPTMFSATLVVDGQVTEGTF